ncbi:MAG: hypothetical protein WD928_04540 [Gammaproteobacteria bacterium]
MLQAPIEQMAFWQLAEFAAHHSPFHAKRAWAGRLRAGERPAVDELPLLYKEDVRDAAAALVATVRPSGHRTRAVGHTSGSTGSPLEIVKSSRQLDLERAENCRLKQSWHRVLPGPHLIVECATERYPLGSCTQRLDADGTPVTTLYGLEAGLVADVATRLQIGSIHSWPSVARGLIAVSRERDGAPLALRAISTRAEVLTPELRGRLRDELGCATLDVYGAVETGVLAAECVDCGLYHTADRSCLIEVLREDGSAAGPGETGWVVVTPLHSYAMPLLRYVLGDYAVVAEPTRCSEGRLTLAAILGREKHLFVTPQGRLFVPMIEAKQLCEMPLQQYKLLQPDFATIEVQYVAFRGTDVDERALHAVVCASLPARFDVRVRQVESIAAAANGKYFMHERLFGDSR